MEAVRKTGLLSIPLAFMLAGIGMIWLLRVVNASGNFFERLASNRTDWLGAHVVLLISSMFLLPAAISIHRAVDHKIAGAVGTSLLLIVGFSSALLAGQYAIDFVMPLLAEVGGDALQVHPLLFDTLLIDLLFYKLPNLVFLGLFLLSCTLFWSKKVPRKVALVLLLNWLLVLTGNLIDPLFQRIAITCLAFSFMPFVVLFWKKDAVEPG